MLSPLTSRLLPLLLTGLAMLGPFSINIYMPSFADMRTSLGVSDVQLQITLSLYFVSFAFMSLWHGMLADSFGRRPVVLAGIVVFTVSTFGIAVSDDIHIIYLLRVLQGFSAGAGIVIGRAVIRDVYEGAMAQRVYATVVMLFAIAPAIGPVIGGFLQVHFGWRSPFIFLGGMGAVLSLLTFVLLPETLPHEHRQPFSLANVLKGYQQVFSHFRFMSWAISFALMFGGFFIYVLSAPIFLTRHLHLGATEFIWLFGPATAGMMLGSFLSGRLASAWSVRRLLRTGFAVMLFAAVLNVSVCVVNPVSFYWYLPYLFFFTLGMALVQPVIMVLGLDCVPHRRGLGSSVQLFVQTSFNALLSAVIAPFFWNSPLQLALGAATLLALSLMGIYFLRWMTVSGRTPKAEQV